MTDLPPDLVIAGFLAIVVIVGAVVASIAVWIEKKDPL